MEIGDVAWQAFSVEFDGEVSSDSETPSWKRKSYEVWFRDPLRIVEAQITNKDYAHEMDYAPKQMFSAAGKCQYLDFMSDNWAWEQAIHRFSILTSDIIAEDPETHGSMFVPVILGSNKTTVSVATGQNEYYPLYASIGNIHNHRHEDSVEFCKFCCQLFHTSLTHILRSLKPWMSKPRITCSADSHLRCLIYGLGPYIANYPEQVLLACVVSGWCPKCTARPAVFNDDPTAILRSRDHTSALMAAFEDKPGVLWDGYGIINYVMPFTTHFPRANIHELLSPYLLHQVIKGMFKVHLVDWVTEYLEAVHTKARAKEILADINQHASPRAEVSNSGRVTT
ncbi:hypothetical protein EI94DRAFT_1753752 [Lactarius quietus]|nr:hypothetical protein EI94DRAFT_1753752 [Lactarius quietus]